MKAYVLLAALVSVFLCSSCSEQNSAEKLPNIVYVLVDDLGYGDLSAYNEQGKIPTPNIDKLAQDGVMFTDAHTSSSVCTPTRYGILTGRYNWRSTLKKGVVSGKSKALIPTGRATVASMLQKQGYATAYIGKWHLGWDWGLKDPDHFGGWGFNPKDFDNLDFTQPITNGPNELGFDYAYGHCGSLDMAPYVYVENGKCTLLPDTLTVNKDPYGFWRKGPTSSDFVHEDVMPNFFRRSFDYIKNAAKADKPFFLYLPLPAPHTPILPTDEWKGKSGLNPYGDFVMMIDSYMGELTKAIAEAGIEENTIVMFTSDNGCSPRANFDVLAEKGHDPSYIFRGGKADIYEGGHRVPFIVKWPKKVAKGVVTNEIICTTDLMATLADIVGYTLADNEGEDSYSLMPVLEQKQLDKPLREATVHHSIEGEFAIRKGDWKFITCAGSGGWSFPTKKDLKKMTDSIPEYQLFNLKEDPSEDKNLYEEMPEKAEELKALLTKYIVDGRSTPGAVQKNDPGKKGWKQIRFTKE